MTTIPTTVMRASKTQRDRTIAEEGLKLQAYKDTIGIWTIGVGHAATNPNPVRGVRAGEYYEGPPDEGVTITALEAERLFNLDFDETERGVSSLVSAPLMQNQFDTLCDFVHQFGLGALGGSTLLLKINRNPNNLGAADNDTGILHELMRWTRAGGDHQEYVWRRSARRACIYAGAPIPQALWRPKGFPFAVTADDKIDYSITPTIYKLIEYGKKAAEPYRFDPSKISLEPKPDASITIITDKPLDLTKDQIIPPAASPGKPEAKEAGAPPPQPTASPASQKQDQPRASAEAVPVPTSPPSPPGPPVPSAKPAPPPIVVPMEKPKAPPVHVDTSGLNTNSMRVDQKPMEFSDRAMWFAVKLFGFWLKVMAGRGAIPLTAVSYYFNFFEDPFLSSVVISGGTWLLGECVTRVAAWRLSFHRSTARTSLV